MGSERQAETAAFTGMDALREACDRNVPVEVFRTSGTGDGAPARGRLLSLNEQELVIERLQMIGEDFAHGVGTKFECYFRLGGELYTFRAVVTESRMAARLNGRFIVPAIKLTPPKIVEPGQRRGVFRVSLGGRADAPRVDVWLSDPYLPVPGETPKPLPPPRDDDEDDDDALLDLMLDGEAGPDDSEQAASKGAGKKEALLDAPQRLEKPRAPELRGRLFDASDTGLGLVIFDFLYTRIRRRARVWVRFGLPEDPEPVEFEAVVRHVAPVREIDSRVGLRLVDDGGREFARKVRRLTAYLTQVQREQRRA